MKRITDPDFKNWQEMNSLRGNPDYWIYFSPDNLYAALVNTINQEIIFISDRNTGEQIYTSPNSGLHAKMFYALNRSQFKARKVI